MSKTIERVDILDILGVSGAFIVVGIGLDVMPSEHESGTILGAGPLVKQDEMTVAYRPVLWMNANGEFIIHDQFFPNAKNGNYNGSYFDRGSYPGGEVAKATELFAERCAKQAYHCGRLGLSAEQLAPTVTDS